MSGMKIFKAMISLVVFVVIFVASWSLMDGGRTFQTIVNWLQAPQHRSSAPQPVKNQALAENKPVPKTLAEARKAFQTQMDLPRSGTPLEKPPAKIFKVVSYPAENGNLQAYLTPEPRDKDKHPAIIWITGGDANTIGDVWSPDERDNAQSASAFRKAGIVMMFPSLRGGNTNPGKREGFYGEVNDILAAADFLAAQPYVDPDRIYLGGHSTGGTLVLLTSMVSGRFRAVFSYGPVDYAVRHASFFAKVDLDKYDEREINLRAPIAWLADIQSPTFIIEGSKGNMSELLKMRSSNTNPAITFIPVSGADHFNTLAPGNEAIAKAILADKGAVPQFSLSEKDFKD